MAGELYGCYGHRTYAHQPCLHDLTDGALQCQYCAAGMVPDWRGYVPVWDRDFALRYVLIGEAHYESVNMITHRSQIVISRAKNPISPLIVRAGELVLTRNLPDCPPWSAPVDMAAMCRVLWKSAELDAWYARSRVAELPGVAPTAPLNAERFSPMMRGAVNKVNRLTEPPSLNDVFAEAVRRGEDPPLPSTNGHHKKKKGPGDA